MDKCVRTIADKGRDLKLHEKQILAALKNIQDEIEIVTMEQLNIKHMIETKEEQNISKQVIEKRAPVFINLDDHLSINKQQMDLDIPVHKGSQRENQEEEEEDSD